MIPVERIREVIDELGVTFKNNEALWKSTKNEWNNGFGFAINHVILNLRELVDEYEAGNPGNPSESERDD